MSLPAVPDNVRPDAPLIVFAKIIAKPGKADELGQAINICVEKSNKEPGTLIYTILRQLDQPDTFLAYEKYENLAAFKEHGKGEALKELVSKNLAAGLELNYTQDIQGFKSKI
ncbi:Dimeric alpha-beta barrel [Phaffia rhodozyma]|uniref:Dimeric alpha-beta barrel n=1 Tax=Phaffia rhodozyma TaxID=264483 RepID=A0A0F7SMF1_PHARH|nr:Dimeric alpha-beta barrel [Phaffia rhodozyma]